MMLETLTFRDQELQVPDIRLTRQPHENELRCTLFDKLSWILQGSRDLINVYLTTKLYFEHETAYQDGMWGVIFRIFRVAILSVYVSPSECSSTCERLAVSQSMSRDAAPKEDVIRLHSARKMWCTI